MNLLYIGTVEGYLLLVELPDGGELYEAIGLIVLSLAALCVRAPAFHYSESIVKFEKSFSLRDALGDSNSFHLSYLIGLVSYTFGSVVSPINLILFPFLFRSHLFQS
jgi:hypothetical protein